MEVAILITDDDTDEYVEHFLGQLMLVISDVTVQLSPHEVQVQIIDNDGKWCDIRMCVCTYVL